MLLALYNTLALIAMLIMYMKSQNSECRSKKRLRGRTCLVTGGTSGIGYRVALDFACRGARVIITGHALDKGISAQQAIKEKSGNPNVVYKFFDLSSLKGTREFAEDILKTEERLDILMNNAGVMIPRYKPTADNLSYTMQVNYYGHFLLTLLLLPLLKRTGTREEKSRIVNTSSSRHDRGVIDIGNMNVIDNSKRRISHYATSKLCLIMFSRELTRNLKDSNVVINNVDPGLVSTGIYVKRFGLILGSLITVYCCLFQQTAWNGAHRCLHAALDYKAGKVSGEYFENCELSKAIDSVYNNELLKKLWDDSIKLVQLSEDELNKCLN